MRYDTIKLNLNSEPLTNFKRITGNIKMITYNNTREIHNKWPAMIVKGDNVTVDQATEILIRTDHNAPNFTYAGNNKAFAEKLNELFGIREKRDDESFSDYWEVTDKIRKKYKILSLRYLVNDQIVSSWIGGPHGWCDWDGTIGSQNYNIGKWPSVIEVAEEWEIIAKAFPFLNLQCQLFNGETCEENIAPIILFTVKNGNVLVEDSDEHLDNIVDEPFDLEGILTGQKEKGISISNLSKKIKTVYNT